MKNRFFLWLLLLIANQVKAQDKFPPLDKSIMDVSYCPNNYPILKVQAQLNGPLIARVVYSRPNKNGRNIFCDLIEYGKVWRVGANEATEIEFFQDVMVNTKKVAKGRYTLYVIPFETKWTVIINKETDTWGSFMYNSNKDIVRMDVPVETLSEPIESLSMYFNLDKKSAQLNIAWDNVKIAFPFTVLKSK